MEKYKKIFYPDPNDDMWNKEVEKLIPWCAGKGADIGCGSRSINGDVIRVDIDEKREPDYVAKGDELPFKDEELDYIVSIHNLEHYEDQRKVLNEWRRVLKDGGIIAIVHPDRDYTGEQQPEESNMDKNPFNKHYHERNELEFHKWFLEQGFKDLTIVDSGKAAINWSFFLILEKKCLD